jgi:hypothetical protein
MCKDQKRRFSPRPESVVNRGRVSEMAASRPDEAFALAQTIPDGWYRCQAMTTIATAAPPLASKAFKAARVAAASGDDAYQRTAVLCGTLCAALESGRPALAGAILKDILAQISGVAPLASRAFALAWLWAVADSAGDAAMRQQTLAAAQAYCHPDRSWRAARLYRDMADGLARRDPKLAKKASEVDAGRQGARKDRAPACHRPRRIARRPVHLSRYPLPRVVTRFAFGLFAYAPAEFWPVGSISHLLTRLLRAKCGCYRARAEFPPVGFPVGGLRAENNSFGGLGGEAFPEPIDGQFPVGPNTHGDQRC